MKLRCWFIAVSTLLLASYVDAQQVIADFESLDGWEVAASDGVEVRITQEAGTSGKCLRIDIDFTAGSGYGGVRKKLDLDLPANYVFSFDVKGDLPPNNFEFKLADTTGDTFKKEKVKKKNFPSQNNVFVLD